MKDTCENTVNKVFREDILVDDISDCMNLINEYETLAIIIMLAKNRIMHLNNGKEIKRLN